MVKVCLAVRGKKHQRSYRVIVKDSRKKRDTGNYLADLGYYNPQIQKIQIAQEELKQWLARGAQLTKGVAKLIQSK